MSAMPADEAGCPRDPEAGGLLLAPLLPEETESEPVAAAASLSAPGKVAAEAGTLWRLGWPLVAEEVVSYASVTVSMIFVGRLGALPLAAASLARSALNITGSALLVGVTSPVDTCVAAVHGARGGALVGQTLQRALLFTLAAATPVVALYCTQARPALVALGQPPLLAAHAARYLRLVSPWLLTHGASLCLYRGLVAQDGVL